jgi:hypothetical protein
MRPFCRKPSVWVGLALAGLAGAPAWAVITLDGPGQLTTAPTGSKLTAWNLQGQYGLFNITPISPNQFIMARHVFGPTYETLGDTVFFRGASYQTVAKTDITRDLRVYTINGTFPEYAPLWNPSVDGSELDKPLAVFGRGRTRGEPIYAPINQGVTLGPVPSSPSIVLTGDGGGAGGGGGSSLLMSPSGPTPAPSGELRGWKWGPYNTQQSWGENVVEFTVNDQDYGPLIGFNFDADPAVRVSNEAAVAERDSSGGVFVLSNGTWKLAGVTLGADNFWSLTEKGRYETASIFDARGLWIGSAASHAQVPYSSVPLSGSSYASSIGANFTSINTAIGGVAAGGIVVPEPAGVSVVLGVLSSVGFAARRRHHARIVPA